MSGRYGAEHSMPEPNFTAMQLICLLGDWMLWNFTVRAAAGATVTAAAITHSVARRAGRRRVTSESIADVAHRTQVAPIRDRPRRPRRGRDRHRGRGRDPAGVP